MSWVRIGILLRLQRDVSKEARTWAEDLR
jgi:hypothetical protein